METNQTYSTISLNATSDISLYAMSDSMVCKTSA